MGNENRRQGEKLVTEALAYSMGMKAGKKHDLISNPQFSSYSERIAYRAGWMDAMKPKAANVKVSGSPTDEPTTENEP